MPSVAFSIMGIILVSVMGLIGLVRYRVMTIRLLSTLFIGSVIAVWLGIIALMIAHLELRHDPNFYQLSLTACLTIGYAFFWLILAIYARVALEHRAERQLHQTSHRVGST